MAEESPIFISKEFVDDIQDVVKYLKIKFTINNVNYITTDKGSE